MGLFNRRSDTRDEGPQARVAAVQEMGLGAPPSFGSRAALPAQARAREFAQKIGFVRNSLRFEGWQAARCTLRPERTTNGVDWEPVTNSIVDGATLDMLTAWETLGSIRSSRGTQEDLVRTSVFLDESEGEFFIVRDPDRPDGSPAWSARSPGAVVKKKGRGSGFLVQTQPGGKPSKRTAFEVPSVHRYWQPAEDFEDYATSVLIGMVSDCQLYWDLRRFIGRETNSRLVMNKMFWTPGEAHRNKRPDKNGQPTAVSELDYQYAQAAAKRANDVDDREVGSVAAWPLHTDTVGANGSMIPKPEIIDMGGLDPKLLDWIRYSAGMVASGLPLTTQGILDGEAPDPNHWNKWAADDDDIEVIDTVLRRVLDAWTDAVFRPLLASLAADGWFDDDPKRWRIGADTDPIRARIDNSENARWAIEQRLIGVNAGLDALHFDESDRADAADLAFYEAAAKARPAVAPAFAAPGALPAAPGQPPEQPLPAPPEAITAGLTLPVLDDRHLFR